MRPLALLLSFAAALAAQSGDYRFVQLSIRDSSAREVKNIGGTISFDGAAAFRIDARMGVNREAAKDLRSSGAYQAVPEGGFIALPNPAQPDLTLHLRAGPNADVLVGSSVDEGQPAHDLFVAIRAPSKPVGNSTLKGDYGAAFLLVYNGLGSGLASAILDFTADGQGSIPSATLTGHAAGIDDSNRLEKFKATTYALRSGGSGGLSIHESSDVFFGDREIFVSEDGGVLLGFSTAEGARDILLAVRKDPDQGTLSFRGSFWISELMAETDFVFRPDASVFSSASGSLTAGGSGSAAIAERVNLNGRRVHLTTTNSFAIDSAGLGILAPRYRQGLHNFSLGAGDSFFLGAQVGAPGELTLEHGIFIGVRVQPPNPSALFLALPATPIAPGAVVSLDGSGFTPDAEVLVNGERASVLKVSPGQIDFLAPSNLSAPTAKIQIRRNGEFSNTIQVPVSPTAPVLISAFHANFTAITPESPAQPGETIVLLATGLALPDPALGLYIDSRPAEILFAGPFPGFLGFYQINATLPATLSPLSAAPIALATTGALADLSSIPIGPAARGGEFSPGNSSQ
jgi:uncharacterized protein (TIGR03437 family)